jgi:outer membrane protein TolC
MKRSVNLNFLAPGSLLTLVMACTAGVGTGAAQPLDTVSLFECRQSAMATHPLGEKKALYQQTKALRQQNYTANWLPALDLNGRYTWQNEVVQLPFDQLPLGFEIPEMPHYNYKLTLDVQQTLYDGGMARSAKEMEEKAFDVNRQSVEVSLNQLKDRVNSIYFYILVLQEQEKTLQLKIDVLKARLQVMESMLQNAAVVQSDLNVIKAEQLKAGQQMAELVISRKSALAVLSELCSLELSDHTRLSLPGTATAAEGSGSLSGYPAAGVMTSGGDTLLPEQVLFDLQISRLDANINLTARQRYPRAFVFAQLGYGNPALDFFRDEFRGFYIVGAGIQWKIWDWSRTSREKQVLAIQQDIIRSEREAFDKNLAMKLEELEANIRKYEEAVQRDAEILQLREQITRAAVSKLENGIITSTEYVTELDAEMQARIQLDLHRIQLVQARVDYLTSKGII